MAFRPTSQLRTMLSRVGVNRGMSTGPTRTATMDAPPKKPKTIKGEFVPVAVVLGLVVVAVMIGMHTAKQQLMHSPSVQVTKKKRETMPEVVDPDSSADDSQKFINKSFLRKVAHIQDQEQRTILSDPIRGDVYKSPKRAETLKSVGVDPKKP